MSKRRLPPGRSQLWAYAAIALIPILILATFYPRLDTLSRFELAIPAASWTVVFSVVAMRRSTRRIRRRQLQAGQA